MIAREEQIIVISKLRDKVPVGNWEALKVLAVIENTVNQFQWDTDELSGLILKLWETIEKK